MTKEQLELLQNIEKIKEKVICAEDLRPFLEDRTLLYGYTCERETFHVYLKDMQIHVVVYGTKFVEDEIRPTDMREIQVTSNYGYIPDKRLYPETCDYKFCRLLQNCNIDLPFAAFQDRPTCDFYGFTLEDV